MFLNIRSLDPTVIVGRPAHSWEAPREARVIVQLCLHDVSTPDSSRSLLFILHKHCIRSEIGGGNVFVRMWWTNQCVAHTEYAWATAYRHLGSAVRYHNLWLKMLSGTRAFQYQEISLVKPFLAILVGPESGRNGMLELVSCSSSLCISSSIT